MIFVMIFLFLAIFGRLACSTVCPLGWIEEWIFKIPFGKKYTKLKYEEQLKKIKYVLFVTLLILVPLLFMPNQGVLKPVFLFVKLFGFTTVFLVSLFIYRPFCKYFCPFGVFLGLFNKISLYRYTVNKNCNQCTLCHIQCKMSIDPYKNPNHMECIRCGECIKHCPKSAIREK